MSREIPLPPVSEQRRAVALIDELASQIHEASTLRRQAVQEAEALTRSALRYAFGANTQADWIPLSYAAEAARILSCGCPGA